jgi:hypothetical protein
MPPSTFKIRNGLKQPVPENMPKPDKVRPTGYELADVIEYSTLSPYTYRSSLGKGGDFTMYSSYVYELKSKHSKNEELPKHIYYIKNKTYTEGIYMKEEVRCDEKDKYVIYDFNHSTKNPRIVLCRVYEPNVKSSSSRTSTKKSYSVLKGGRRKYNKTKEVKRARTRRRY